MLRRHGYKLVNSHTWGSSSSAAPRETAYPPPTQSQGRGTEAEEAGGTCSKPSSKLEKKAFEPPRHTLKCPSPSNAWSFPTEEPQAFTSLRVCCLFVYVNSGKGGHPIPRDRANEKGEGLLPAPLQTRNKSRCLWQETEKL